MAETEEYLANLSGHEVLGVSGVRRWCDNTLVNALFAVADRKAAAQGQRFTATADVPAASPLNETDIVTREDVRHVLTVRLAGGETFELRGSLVSIREELAPYVPLVAVGKSLLVNPAHLFAIEDTRITLADRETREVPKSAVLALRAAMLAVYASENRHRAYPMITRTGRRG